MRSSQSVLFLRLCIAALLALGAVQQSSAQCTQTWSNLGQGFDATTYAVTTRAAPGSTVTEVYAGGLFSSSGGTPMRGVAKWNGTGWSLIGALPTGYIRALTTMPNGDLIACGQFSTIGGVVSTNIAKWNGTSWSALGTSGGGGSSGINAVDVACLLVTRSGELMAGGSLGTPSTGVLKLVGNVWQPVGTGLNANVKELAEIGNGDLVAVGTFRPLTGTGPGNYVARLPAPHTGAWQPVGSGPGGANGVDSSAFAIVADPKNPNGFYIGGSFSKANYSVSAGSGTDSGGVAYWNGLTWEAGAPPAPNPLGFVISLTWAADGSLVAASLADDLQLSRLSCRAGGPNGSPATWRTVGSGANGNLSLVRTLPNGDLIIGGAFTSINGVSANRIATLRSTWSEQIAPGWAPTPPGQDVRYLAARSAPGTQYYRSGPELAFGASPAWRWNGQVYEPVAIVSGPGAVNGVAASPLPEGDMIVFGSFGGASNWQSIASDAAFVARFGGADGVLARVGTSGGPTSEVFACAMDRAGKVYASTDSTVGGVAASTIHVFNGGSWSTLPQPVYGNVRAMAILPDGSPVAGGALLTVGGAAARTLVRWTGSTWENYANTGAGNFSFTTGLAVMADGSLLACGGFNVLPGNVGIYRVARFDGRAWGDVASTPPSLPLAVAVLPNGEAVYSVGQSVYRIGFTPVELSASTTITREVDCSPYAVLGTPGQQVSLTASASAFPGSMIRYQWRVSGQAIPVSENETANSPTLRLPMHRPGNEQYDCLISYGCASAVATGAGNPGLPRPRWVQINSPSAPAARTELSMAWAGGTSESLVVAGSGPGGTYGDTWAFDGLRWRHVQTANVSPRTASALAGSDFGGLLLFGGYGAGADTYSFDGERWVNISGGLSTAPSARFWSMAAPTFDGMLLFGGENYSSTPLNDTWSIGGFAGQDWTQVSAGAGVVPPIRGRGAMAQTVTNRSFSTLLFGGRTGANGTIWGDTWNLNESWTPLPVGGPQPRFGHTMVYDPVRDATILFGGVGGDGTPLNDLWEYRGGRWTPVITDGPTPPGRSSHGMAFDPERKAVVIFGGQGAGGTLGDTWLLCYGPQFTVAPQRGMQDVCFSSTTQAAVQATAPGAALSYQWTLNGQPIDAGAVPSAVTATLSLPGALLGGGNGGEADIACTVTAHYSDALGTACISAATPARTFVLSPADVGSQGGAAGPDGHFDNNDFVVFINLFFDQNERADLGAQGGVRGRDGRFDNNDFIAFIDLFFAGCS